MFQASKVCCIQLIPTMSMQFCEIQASLGGGVGVSLVSHLALCSPPNPIYIRWDLKCTLKAIFYGPPFSQQGFYQNWLELEFPWPQATLTRPFPFSHSCATDATTPHALQISRYITLIIGLVCHPSPAMCFLWQFIVVVMRSYAVEILG
jgi:hypothetical protein